MKVQLIKTILSWMTFWFHWNVRNREAAIEELLTKVVLWAESKGWLWVILHLKEIRLLYTRHLCNDPVRVSNRIIGIRKDGLPKGFPILNSIFLRGSKQDVSFILTLLSISRVIKAWKDPSTSTITSDYTGAINDFEVYKDRIIRVAKDFKLNRFDLKWDQGDHYYSIKAGPNGLATFSAPWDAIKNGYKLYPTLNKLNPLLANFVLLWSSYSESLRDDFINPKRTNDGLLRKLGVVKDPEGKSRIIAIFDYWSQTILRIIHLKCYDYLNNFSQDRTFTQDPHVDFAGPYYSFDLTAATDRFPIGFQMLLMEHLLGKEKAEAWKSLLIDEEFYVPWEDSTVKYTVGQPMGAYSSWAVFSLCHHIIVQIAAIEVGEYPTRNYILLGDDIVIGGASLARAYQRHIELLGLEISSHKTHVSSNTYEFAKRWFRDGIEVSGLQVSAFIGNINNYALIVQTLLSYQERGFIPYGFISISELIFDLNIRLGNHLKFSKSIYRKTETLHALIRWIHKGDMLPMRNLLANILPHDAPVPSGDSPYLLPYLTMRLESVLARSHNRLLKAIDGLSNKFINKLTSKYSLAWPEGYGGVTPDTNAEFHSDVIATVNGSIIGPGGILNLPVTQALKNLNERLRKDVRLFRPEQDFKEAINALCIPDIERIGSTKTKDSIKLLTTKIAQEFVLSAKLYLTDSNLLYTEETYFNVDSDFTRIAASALPDPDWKSKTLAEQLGPDFDFTNFM